jgi:hypothetical protein
MVAEQAQRVRFQRGPSVWDADLPASAYTLELPEFCAVDAWPVDGDDIVLRGDVAAGDVPGGLDRLADEVGRRLFDGPGFTIVRGFPVASKGWAVSARTYAWLMSRFGRLIAQNTAGDPLHLVRTKGLGADKQYGSRGSGELVFHTDQAAAPPEMLPEVLGLLCLDRAAEGGRTQLVSGHALLNELLREAPAAVDALSEPIPFGRDADGVSDAPALVARPIEWTASGRARLRYNRYFTEVGAEQLGRSLAPEVVAAFDAVDELVPREQLAVDLLLEPGDALIADNAVVMHNRSAYVDSADHTRCMVRAWAKA